MTPDQRAAIQAAVEVFTDADEILEVAIDCWNVLHAVGHFDEPDVVMEDLRDRARDVRDALAKLLEDGDG